MGDHSLAARSSETRSNDTTSVKAGARSSTAERAMSPQPDHNCGFLGSRLVYLNRTLRDMSCESKTAFRCQSDTACLPGAGNDLNEDR
jgi:hypothetical protein